MPEQTVLEVLKAARALIADPERWTQAAFARTEQGKVVKPWSPSASCWCATGALWKVVGATEERLFADAKDALYFGTYQRHIAEANDDNDHAYIIRRFDKAIARLEQTNA